MTGFAGLERAWNPGTSFRAGVRPYAAPPSTSTGNQIAESPARRHSTHIRPFHYIFVVDPGSAVYVEDPGSAVYWGAFPCRMPSVITSPPAAAQDRSDDSALIGAADREQFLAPGAWRRQAGTCRVPVVVVLRGVIPGRGRSLCVPWGASAARCQCSGAFGLEGVFCASQCTKSSRKPKYSTVNPVI
jgi:hypothetical protein